MPNTEITDDYIKNAILSTTSTGAYLIKIIQDNNVCAILQGHNVSENYRFYVAFSYYNIGYVNKIKTFKLRLEEWTIETYITNTDLTERFKPIRIFGTEGGTFSKTLKNKVYNSVVFLAFDTGVPDNPFSFEAEYAIAFHAGLLKAENVFTLIGFDSSALHPLEIKMLDLRS